MKININIVDNTPVAIKITTGLHGRRAAKLVLPALPRTGVAKKNLKYSPRGDGKTTKTIIFAPAITGSVAQLVEQLTLNQRVQGSSPCGTTKDKDYIL